MVAYQIPKPPQGLLARMRDGLRLGAAFLKGDKTTIADITSETIFSPLQPLPPFTPQIVGRNWDFMPGQNLQFIPRGYGSGRIPFTTLRTFSRSCETLRLAIETVKDQIGAYAWQFIPKEDSKAAPDDPRIKELTEFFKKPDKINTFEIWLRTVLEDYIVIDALSIYRPKTRIGLPYAFEVIDGATIKPLIDANGRRPLPPDPAYQQVLKGGPRVDYDTTELLYMPRNKMSYDPVYGLSITEQIILTIQTEIERKKYQLAYFTEGSVPDAYAVMPEDMTVDAIKAFEERFNNMLAGNASGRRQVPFLPSGASIESLKEPPLKDEFDEWIARIICYALGLSPTAFIKQMNRSTSEMDTQREEEQGQGPKMIFVESVINELIGDFGEDYARDFEFKFREKSKLNADTQSQIDDRNVKNATATINEIRAARGQDPIEGGDQPMVLTATGYVPLDSFQQNMDMQERNAAATAQAFAEGGKEGEEGEEGEKKKKEEKLYGRVRKAVRLSPIPFKDPPRCGHKHP